MKRKQADGSYKWYILIKTAGKDKFVEVEKKIHDAYYAANWSDVYEFNRKYGYCKCTYSYYCHGDCAFCQYRCTPDKSFDECIDNGMNFVDAADIEKEVDNSCLLQSLKEKAEELVKDGEKILTLMVQEYTEREISEKLDIPKTTVHDRIQKIKKGIKTIVKK